MGLIYIIRISEKGQPWKHSRYEGISLDRCRELLMGRMPKNRDAVGEIYKISDSKEKDAVRLIRRMGVQGNSVNDDIVRYYATKCDTVIWVPEKKMFRFGSGKYGSV